MDQTLTENNGTASPSPPSPPLPQIRAVSAPELQAMRASVARPPCANASMAHPSTNTRRVSMSGRGRLEPAGASGTRLSANAPSLPEVMTTSEPGAGGGAGDGLNGTDPVTIDPPPHTDTQPTTSAGNPVMGIFPWLRPSTKNSSACGVRLALTFWPPLKGAPYTRPGRLPGGTGGSEEFLNRPEARYSHACSVG